MEEKFRDYAQLYEAIRFLAMENKRLTDEIKKSVDKIDEMKKDIRSLPTKKDLEKLKPKEKISKWDQFLRSIKKK